MGKQVLEEVSKLADAGITDEDVEPSPLIRHSIDQILGRLWE